MYKIQWFNPERLLWEDRREDMQYDVVYRVFSEAKQEFTTAFKEAPPRLTLAYRIVYVMADGRLRHYEKFVIDGQKDRIYSIVLSQEAARYLGDVQIGYEELEEPCPDLYRVRRATKERPDVSWTSEVIEELAKAGFAIHAIEILDILDGS